MALYLRDEPSFLDRPLRRSRDQRVLVEGMVDEDWVKLGYPERGYVARRYLGQTPSE